MERYYYGHQSILTVGRSSYSCSIVHAFCINLWPWPMTFTFNPCEYVHAHAKNQGQRSDGSSEPIHNRKIRFDSTYYHFRSYHEKLGTVWKICACRTIFLFVFFAVFSLFFIVAPHSTVLHILHTWWIKMNTIRYDKRCYFNVHSKAGMSQLLNLPHGNNN